MKQEDFSLSKFNKTMQADIAKQSLNFCKAIILSHKKISLTLTYKPDRFQEKYAVLNPDLSVGLSGEFSSYYYGASPKIDSFSVIDAISKLDFRTVEELEAYISRHCAEFMLHEDQAEYLPDIAKLILLTMASKYGIELKLSKEFDFLTIADNAFSAITSINEKENTLLLRGCPTAELMEKLRQYRFANQNGVWEIAENGIGLAEIYADKANVKLLSGKVFYSGVLLRPLEISLQKYNFENNGISNYQIMYERSSFATVCAFDDNYVDHPLLDSCRDKLKKFFDYDDSCKASLSEQLSEDGLNDEKALAYINDYIHRSYNVNQLNVSSNIKTPKGEILFGLRGSKNIDGGALYPSVNGNAEVYDEDVQFYNNSVYEDLPTIHTDKKRSDLLGEIAREAYGELNLTSARETWSCHGVIMSGNLPNKEDGGSKFRRCHFNVLFENEVSESLEEIRQRYKNASESFENKSFAAIKIKYYKSKMHGALGGLMGFLQNILRSKDIVESVLLLVVTFMSIKTIDLSFENLSSILSILFAAIVLLITIIKVLPRSIITYRNAKDTRKVRIYGSMSYEDLCSEVSKAMKNAYHPAAYASLKMHIENIAISNLRGK